MGEDLYFPREDEVIQSVAILLIALILIDYAPCMGHPSDAVDHIHAKRTS